MPQPGSAVPLQGRWLRVTFAEQRRPLDEQDAATGILYTGPPGYIVPPRMHSTMPEQYAREMPQSLLADKLLRAAGDKEVGAGSGTVDAFTALKAASVDASQSRRPPGGTTSPSAPAPASRSQPHGKPGRIECPLCLGLFARGRGLRMHLTADATGRGHGLSGDLLAAAVEAAELSTRGDGRGTSDGSRPDNAEGTSTGTNGGGSGGAASGAGAVVPSGAGCGAGTSEPKAARREDPGITAAKAGDLTTLQSLGDSWDVNAVDKNGACALHWAAGAGRWKRVRVVWLAISRRMCAPNAGSGHLEMCKYIVDTCGGEVDARVVKGRRDGRNALHWAARNGHTHVCKWLVSRGVGVDAPTKDGTTALHWTVWQNHLDTARWLVSAGADTHAVNSFGCTAVHWAALAGSTDAMRWLVTLGLDVASQNVQGHSALQKAAFKGHTHLVEWLLRLPHAGSSHSASPGGDGGAPLPPAEAGRLDHGGYSAINMARLAGHFALAERLAEWEAAHSGSHANGVSV